MSVGDCLEAKPRASNGTEVRSWARDQDCEPRKSQKRKVGPNVTFRLFCAAIVEVNHRRLPAAIQTFPRSPQCRLLDKSKPGVTSRNCSKRTGESRQRILGGGVEI